MRGFFTNPSRADDCFVPFRSNNIVASGKSDTTHTTSITVPNGTTKALAICTVCTSMDKATSVVLSGEGLVKTTKLYEQNVCPDYNRSTTTVVYEVELIPNENLTATAINYCASPYIVGVSIVLIS